ncbi:PAS domain S-box-containing protein [Krasilnikovia cinnamomea]|uniref:histidine kinase n=1 Tax=Krasilnikovia cinnamomea TaxID=349313 RepID=A0A4Q7ZNT3_9ACTN|nr:PAS domain S-box-containing protein [Krasilnikovia cinnamomea]
MRGAALAGLQMEPGGPVQTTANRLAALVARAAAAPTAMIHVAEGRSIRLMGGWGVPPGYPRTAAIPASHTLFGLVIQYGFPLVIEDVRLDARVPAEAPVRAMGVRSYAGFPVRDPDGVIVGVCAVMDMHPRHWLAEELAAVDEAAQTCTALVGQRYARQQVEIQRSFLDTLLNSLDTGVLACDPDGRLVMVNRSLRLLLGIAADYQPPEQWLRALPVTHPDGRPFTADEVPVLQALEGRHVHGVEHAIATPEGGRRLYSVNAHPITRADGERLGAVSVFHDITLRRRAERFRGCELAVTLALNEAQTVEEAAPRVLAAIAETLGWPYAELWLVEPTPGGEVLRHVDRYRSPRLSSDLTPPARLMPGQGLAGTAWQRAQPVWQTSVGETGGPVTVEAADHAGLRTALALPISSGGRTLAVMTLFADEVEDPQDDLVDTLSGVATQIGQFIERRRAEELQHALTASKDEYLHLVGHELRTPLTVIASYIELIEEADPASTLAEVAPMTAAIQRGSDRLRRLVEALLDLSSLDSGRAEVRRAPIDFADVVAAAVDKARPAAEAADVTITTYLPADLQITGDRERLSQMVAELLDNAITFTPAGGRIEVRLTRGEDWADLIIADTGAGIPEEERPHIFQRFYRGQITTERAIAGAGLGLPVAQLIAQRHHGEITLLPTDTGTAMCVRLPVDPLAVKPPPPTQVGPPAAERAQLLEAPADDFE